MTEEDIKPNWDPANLIADRLKLDFRSVNNVIKLLDDGATIPFIARYRKEMTDNMDPDKVRDVASGVEELREVEAKVQNVYKSIKKMGKMTKDLDTSLRQSTSVLEVESVYAPFKPGHKGTYAERARALGLEPIARNLLDGMNVHLESAVNVTEKGLETVGDVEKGVKHIIADIVSKDKDVLNEINKISGVQIESSKGKKSSAVKKEKSGTSKKAIGKENVEKKFMQYLDFKIPVSCVKSHQILALNRGEDQKILSVKVTIPSMAKNTFMNCATGKYLQKVESPQHRILIQQALLDAYDRLIEPMLCRQIRSDLTKKAEKESLTVFSTNLKQLLLTQPLKNKIILGIDPGFKNGCKLAVVSPTSQVLWTGVAYLHQSPQTWLEIKNISSVVDTYRCEVIAIGNGVACRETEKIISAMIVRGQFSSHTVMYCIVDECGASIYSVSEEAKKDLPELDPTLRGAVSLARRLQDPLAELVKIEPKHLGVGMYQHDLTGSKLQTALNSVVEECVSFVGVDINTCSQSLLRQVAGLNATKAKNVLEWRAKNGYFKNRQQLLTVKGLGKKGFEQCAGFVRISKYTVMSDSSKTEHGGPKEEVKVEACETEELVGKGRKRKTNAAGPSKRKKAKVEVQEEWNPLDATAIHPESYDLAYRLAAHLQVSIDDIGTDNFIRIVRSRGYENNLQKFCEKEDAGLATVQLIVEAFKQPLSYDFRENSQQKPLFKREVTSVSDLRCGAEVTGRVTNVTHFGAFVDIGVGINGLIHTSRMGRNAQPGLGDHVTVIVQTIDLDRSRIGLSLKCVSQT